MDNSFKAIIKALAATRLPHRPFPYIHGVVTASAISPESLSIEQYLVAVFTIETKEELDRRKPDPKAVTEFIFAVNDAEDSILDSIERGDFAPFLDSGIIPVSERDALQAWCKGFCDVVHLLERLWIRDEKRFMRYGKYFVPIQYYADPTGFASEPEVTDMFDLRYKDDSVEIVAESVACLHEFWMDEYGVDETTDDELSDTTYEIDPLDEEDELQLPVTRAEPKTGRNDPCPCGSGKKYKHCHGKLS